MSSNRLSLNPSKTEVIWFASPRRQNSIDRLNIHVLDTNVSPVDTVRDLGLYLDSSLSFIPHINRVISACFYQLRQIKLARRYLTFSSSKLLITSLIMPRLDYCNSVLYLLPKYQMQRLQAVLNASARLIFNRPFHCHITKLLVDLHWLSFPQRIEYKICVLVYKALHGLVPNYLSEICQELSSISGTRSCLRSASHRGLLVPKYRSNFGMRSFQYSGPALWNLLPGHIRAAPSIDKFTSLLKTHLFRTSYPAEYTAN